MDCGACNVEHCPAKHDIDALERPFEGWRFVLLAAFYFLLPVLSGIGGAMSAGDSINHQCAGGFGGLLLGMVLTSLAARQLRE